MEKFDFSGWATKNNLRCSDGRTICKDAFKDNNGQTVPLVWNHQHNDPFNVLGHAVLENKEEGVYAYCKFNDTEQGQNAKLIVEHGDVMALSIYANQLKQQGQSVLHGAIREVSIVLAGANPGAFIDSIIAHGEESNEEAIIYTGEELTLFHADENKKDDSAVNTEDSKKEPDKETEDKETIADVFNTMSAKQQNVVYAMVAMALEDESKDAKHSDNTNENNNDSEGGNEIMKHNVFDKEDQNKDVLSHSDMEAVIADAKRYGSLKDSALQHGITDVEYLFPEAQTLNKTPEFIKRDAGWVGKVMNGIHHTPFSRIKSVFADITADDARAKGYVKGNLKMEEVFSLLKRTTTPTTVYKKQKMDRDDVVDITDFDVVAFLKSEMRGQLDEELARAFLTGDKRLSSSDDKINEQNIRPIWTDADLYTVKKVVSNASTATDDQKARAFIKEVIKARKDYKGSGNPSLYTTEDMLANCLLIEDTTGRTIYDSVEQLATTLRVKEIITVPVMDDCTRTVSGATHTLDGIVVNLADYNVGADKGGAVNMFDDFDIDYNQQKYLIETRCSGALTKPYSAIVIESKVSD